MLRKRVGSARGTSWTDIHSVVVDIVVTGLQVSRPKSWRIEVRYEDKDRVTDRGVWRILRPRNV
ncbi:hypothetical protein KL939_005436, partial [Ogataea angusta]